jgi:hypothetical protein
MMILVLWDFHASLIVRQKAFLPFFRGLSRTIALSSTAICTLKGRYVKNPNRVITSLFHAIRMVKFGSHPCRGARELVLVADNASDNKNNDLFAFAAELIARGWFDSVMIVFGPVGHTHNGNDSIHYCHNQIVGNSFCVTLH